MGIGCLPPHFLRLIRKPSKIITKKNITPSSPKILPLSVKQISSKDDLILFHNHWSL
jgi:hypothetical protein